MSFLWLGFGAESDDIVLKLSQVLMAQLVLTKVPEADCTDTVRISQPLCSIEACQILLKYK